MGLERLLGSFLLTLTVALITYNIITTTTTIHNSSNGSAADDEGEADAFVSVDTAIRLPNHFRQQKRLFHTALTATDSSYNRWQCRIMYYWFKQLRNKPGSEMGGFTRILHSGNPDNLMDEIPTFVADPLPEGLDKGYVVLNRPWAFVQWLKKAEIEEEYVLMAEPDHIIVKPMPNLATEDFPAAFPFFYITPEKYEAIIRKFFDEDKGPVTNIDPIGNSPVIIKKASLKKIAPTWLNISLAMKNDPEADRAFGWVLEMYGYAIASALHGVQHVLRKDFMIQPPWDPEVSDNFIIHYTYGCDYDMKGKLTYGKIGEWRFDKRSFEHGAPPRNLMLPPPGVPESVNISTDNQHGSFNKLKLHEVRSLQKCHNAYATCSSEVYHKSSKLVTLVKMVNEATANIPSWKEGE